MIKKTLYIFTILFFLFLFSITTIKISKEPTMMNTMTVQKEEIGKIIIKKINLEKNLYEINSPQNTVEKNVTILKESTPPIEKESIMILAAHSGTGDIAYFNSLDK